MRRSIKAWKGMRWLVRITVLILVIGRDGLWKVAVGIVTTFGRKFELHLIELVVVLPEHVNIFVATSLRICVGIVRRGRVPLGGSKSFYLT